MAGLAAMVTTLGCTLQTWASFGQNSHTTVEETKTQVALHNSTLANIASRLSAAERGLTSSIEGPLARHSNQIKSLIDRFDSTSVELRRIQGISATQNAALTNRINEVRRSIQNLESKIPNLERSPAPVPPVATLTLDRKTLKESRELDERGVSEHLFY